MAEPRSLLITDDDALVRASYQRFFAAGDQFVVCAEARNGAEAVEAYAEHRPDAVLMDLQMPVVDGVQATRQICIRWPDACVVIMTSFDSREYLVEALRAGGAGYLLKDVGGPGLIAGLNQALAGDMPLSGGVRKELVSHVLAERTARAVAEQAAERVTDKERELLHWLAHGMTNRQIAAKMFLSEGSVKQYLLNIGRKLGTRSRTGILIQAVRFNLVDLDDLEITG